MTKRKPTETAQTLIDELRKFNVKVVSEYDDGHKRVDMAIPSANMYIEVDETHHYFRASQIISDFSRDSHSTIDDKISTFRVPSLIVDLYLGKVVRAILKVIEVREAENHKNN